MDEFQLLDAFIGKALAEDIGDGDHTSAACIPAGVKGKAQLIIREEGILAGIQVASRVFDKVDPELKVEWLMNDGSRVKKNDIVCRVQGSVHAILRAERLVLNIMQRMSGIATRARQAVDKISHTKVRILDTRKTTPGMRALEKQAVRIGGAYNHRFGLYDMILIKDNHVDYAGGIKEAILAARRYIVETSKNLKVEIEVRNMNELNIVLATGGIDRIMLDNFSPPMLTEAVKLVGGKFETEASGNITLDNVVEYAESGVDFISMGMLTHSVKSLDMSLKAC